MIAYEFMHEDDFGIDGGRKRVRLCEEFVLRVIFDGADCSRPLFWSYRLIVGDFLRTNEASQGCYTVEM